MRGWRTMTAQAAAAAAKLRDRLHEPGRRSGRPSAHGAELLKPTKPTTHRICAQLVLFSRVWAGGLSVIGGGAFHCLDTSRRRAADASAPLERAPTSERVVAGQLPRPARRSKKGACAAGTLRGRAARGGVLCALALHAGPCSFIILEMRRQGLGRAGARDCDLTITYNLRTRPSSKASSACLRCRWRALKARAARARRRRRWRRRRTGRSTAGAARSLVCGAW